MVQRFEHLPLRAELVNELRSRAANGEAIPELIEVIRVHLGFQEPAVIPTLAYFARAFCLPLPRVLPLREWLGPERDPAIDSQILADMATTKSEWIDRHELTPDELSSSKVEV